MVVVGGGWSSQGGTRPRQVSFGNAGGSLISNARALSVREPATRQRRLSHERRKAREGIFLDFPTWRLGDLATFRRASWRHCLTWGPVSPSHCRSFESHDLWEPIWRVHTLPHRAQDPFLWAKMCISFPPHTQRSSTAPRGRNRIVPTRWKRASPSSTTCPHLNGIRNGVS